MFCMLQLATIKEYSKAYTLYKLGKAWWYVFYVTYKQRNAQSCFVKKYSNGLPCFYIKQEKYGPEKQSHMCCVSYVP